MAFLRAFGCFVPGRAIGNAELAARLGCEAEWIANVSGIAERRYAGPTETVAEMAVRAAEDCLAAGGIAASSIGCVMVSSGSAERRFPDRRRKSRRVWESPARPRWTCRWPAPARSLESLWPRIWPALTGACW